MTRAAWCTHPTKKINVFENWWNIDDKASRIALCKSQVPPYYTHGNSWIEYKISHYIVLSIFLSNKKTVKGYIGMTTFNQTIYYVFFCRRLKTGWTTATLLITRRHFRSEWMWSTIFTTVTSKHPRQTCFCSGSHSDRSSPTACRVSTRPSPPQPPPCALNSSTCCLKRMKMTDPFWRNLW